MLLNAVRGLSGCGHVLVGAPLALLGFRSITSAEWHKSGSRFFNVWEQVLHSAKSSPEKLHDIVDVLSKHCVATQTAPPLDAFNELIRLCDAHGDVHSVHKLTQMSMAVSMHLDEQTYMRLEKFFNYFPRPFPDSARIASSIHNSSTNSSNTQHIPTAATAASTSTHSSSSSSGVVHDPQPRSSSSSNTGLTGQSSSFPSAHGSSSSTSWTPPSSNIGPGRAWPRPSVGYNATASAATRAQEHSSQVQSGKSAGHRDSSDSGNGQ